VSGYSVNQKYSVDYNGIWFGLVPALDINWVEGYQSLNVVSSYFAYTVTRNPPRRGGPKRPIQPVSF
jgi:hypothetical protein